MAYLERDDYTLHISIDHLDQILTQAARSSGKTTEQLREEAEATAEAEILARLKGYYDIETELKLAHTDDPDTRNRLVKKCMIDIALYHIHFTVNPRDIPEIRRALYDNCIEMLKEAQGGVIDIGLPIPDADGDGESDTGYSRIMFESSTKFISKPFTDPSIQEE